MRSKTIAQFLGAASLAFLALGATASHADSWSIRYSDGGPSPYRPVVVPAPMVAMPGAYCPPRGVSPVGVDARQANQMDRIYDGIRAGQLTPWEAQRLIGEQQRIDSLQRRFLADGRLTRDEWRVLDNRLDDASRDIYQERHDYDGGRYGTPGHHHGW